MHASTLVSPALRLSEHCRRNSKNLRVVGRGGVCRELCPLGMTLEFMNSQLMCYPHETRAWRHAILSFSYSPCWPVTGQIAVDDFALLVILSPPLKSQDYRRAAAHTLHMWCWGLNRGSVPAPEASHWLSHILLAPVMQLLGSPPPRAVRWKHCKDQRGKAVVAAVSRTSAHDQHKRTWRAFCTCSQSFPDLRKLRGVDRELEEIDR